jgi:hypothetical protein
MKKSLHFIPDISGFTQFVQTTEVAHSQHVIAELLEVLLAANTQDLELTEIEGDALFFFKEEEIPPLDKILGQVETMFTAFYSHLKLLEENRICPCNACATAPNLELKVIVHCGELQFNTVQGKRKPFGRQVIEVHRLMKNSVDSDNYVLFSDELVQEVKLPEGYQSTLYQFQSGSNEYDGKEVPYHYSVIDAGQLKLSRFPQAKEVTFKRSPDLREFRSFSVSAEAVLEHITNFTYRHLWVDGVDRFEFDPDEVTRLGTEHVCVIGGNHFNFTTITKPAELPNQLIYGEMTTDPPPVDTLYQFFVLTPTAPDSCKLEAQVYFEAKSPLKRIIIGLAARRIARKNLQQSLDKLQQLVHEKEGVVVKS